MSDLIDTQELLDRLDLVAADEKLELDGAISAELLGAMVRRFRALATATSRLFAGGAIAAVNVVPPAELPAEAPGGTLWRTTTSPDLFLGNGPGRPLTRFTAAP